MGLGGRRCGCGVERDCQVSLRCWFGVGMQAYFSLGRRNDQVATIKKAVSALKITVDVDTNNLLRSGIVLAVSTPSTFSQRAIQYLICDV